VAGSGVVSNARECLTGDLRRVCREARAWLHEAPHQQLAVTKHVHACILSSSPAGSEVVLRFLTGVTRPRTVGHRFGVCEPCEMRSRAARPIAPGRLRGCG
jgi:hypothetical protein